MATSFKMNELRQLTSGMSLMAACLRPSVSEVCGLDVDVSADPLLDGGELGGRGLRVEDQTSLSE